MKNKPLIIIAGATATGKTSLSIELAKKINGEIISADSMLVYKYMNIGTAKPTKEEMKNIKHYMIDKYDPSCRFSIARFKDDVFESIREIYDKGKIPILVGGTGFYINSIIYNTDFTESKNDKTYRTKLENISKEDDGNEKLYEMLKKVDIESTEKIHINNVKKVIRALEFHEENKFPISKHNKLEKNREKYFDVSMFVLNVDREKLYERINERVDVMIANGLIDEVKFLLSKGYKKDLVAMQGIGYKEIIEHLEGDISLDEAIDNIKKHTRNFAKRQITWFKHQSDGEWIDMLDYKNLNSIVDRVLKNIKIEGI